MASGWINTLKFKACLKFPDQYSTARVDLCTDVLGRHIVVKYVPKDNKEVGDSSSEPEGLIYEVYVSLEGLELVQNIPKLIDSDVHTNGGHTWYRQAYEYCHGSDLEELVSYATAEGQHLPEDFIWHIIKNFIEYCYSLNKCGRTISYFDPQHLLFLFDEKAGFSYPRIMFCGFGAVVEESKRYLMKRSMTFYEAIDSFGQYLLSHVISIPSNPVNKTYYSEPLIVWLRVMSGRDGGPQRYVDLENLVQMLWERIEAFQSPYAGLDKHPWLKDYFGQLQLELDTTFTYGTRLTFGPSEAAGMIKSYLTEDHVHIDVMHNFAFLPPKLRRGNGIASTAEALSAYLGAHLEHQGLDLVEAVKQWPWKFDPTVNNLERMLQALSDVMYDSLERSIKLATWSAEFVKPVQGAMQEIPKTRAFYDRVESNVLVRLIENVAYLHEKLIDGFFKIMAEARGSGSAGSDDPHEKAVKDIYQLLEEVDSRYRNALLVVYYEAELWFLATREVRSSIAVRNSLMTLEKWFDIRIRATEMAIQFVNEPSSDFGSSIDRYLRLELSVSLDKPLEELVERRIVALINEKNMVFPRQKYGYEYRMPDWKETSVEREDRNSRLNKTRRESWDKYIHNIRNNATNWVEGRTRSPLRKTPSPERISPGLKVGGSISYAYTDEAEFRKMKGRPPAVPRRRSQIPKNEYRVFKMFKYHDAQYARGYWYTNVGLLENFRQMFQRGSLTFEETKELFNKKSNGTGSILLGDRIKTSEHAIKAIETALMDYHPTTEFEDMDSCTSGSDHDIPVRERLETWDVTSSEGTQDGEGRWVSKRNLDSEGKRRRRRLRAD